MKNLKIKFLNIENIKMLEKIESDTADYLETKPAAANKSLSDLWNERQNFIQAGIPREFIALHYDIIFESRELAITDVSKSIIVFFEDQFKEDNLLSVRLSKKDIEFHFQILVYPLRGRILDSSPWIKNNEIAIEFMQYFYRKMEEYLNISFDKTELNKTIADEKVLNTAKIDIISELNIPESTDSCKTELIYDARGRGSQVQTSIAYEKLEVIINQTLKYFTVGNERMLFKQAQTGQITQIKFLEQVVDYLDRNYSLDSIDTRVVKDKIDSAVFGNYILDDLLNDDAVSDIKILGPNKIRVKVNGQRMTSNLGFIDTEDYFRFINAIAIRNNLDLQNNAIMPFTDTVTNPKCIMRFNITTPYVNSVPYPYLHIRKIRKDKYSIQDLIRLKMMTKDVADYLVYKARNGKGIVFTGKGASGKTTAMNTLLDEIPYTNSGLVIQESDELFSDKHPDFMFQHIVNLGYLQYSLQDEARNGLLTDLDYFIIGEIKGAEALYFLNAADTGHRCWCSVHSPSSVDAINKLADYVMYESKYNKEDALYMLKELDTIVYMKNFKVYEISEVAGWDEEKKNLIYKTIYKR